MKKLRYVAATLILTLVMALTASLGYTGVSATETGTGISAVKNVVAKQKKKYKGSLLTSKKQYYNTTLPLIDGYLKNLQGYNSEAYSRGYKGYGESKLDAVKKGYDECLQSAVETLDRYVLREFPINSSDARSDAKKLKNLLLELPDGATSCLGAYNNGKADKEKDVCCYIDSIALGNYLTDGSIDFYSLFTNYKLADKFNAAFKEVPLGSHYTGTKLFHKYKSDGSIQSSDYYSSKECFAFAEFLDNYVFKADHLGRDGNSNIVLQNVSINAETVNKSAFDKAGVKPGTSIRVTSSSSIHSLTLIGYTDKRVVFTDCNSGQVEGYCTVRVAVVTWSEFRDYCSANGKKLTSVCVKKNYDSYVEKL